MQLTILQQKPINHVVLGRTRDNMEISLLNTKLKRQVGLFDYRVDSLVSIHVQYLGIKGFFFRQSPRTVLL